MKIIESEKIDKFNVEDVIDTIIYGDCVNTLKKFPENFVHLIITSPPYNVGKEYKNHNDKLPYNNYLDWLYNVWIETKRVLVDGGRICVNVPSVTADGEYKPLFADIIHQMKDIGMIMRGDILWYKQAISKRTAWGSFMSPSNPYVVQPYEFILVFSKGKRKLEGNKEDIDITRGEFIEFSNSFWYITPETKNKNHPAPFPQKLAYRLIKFYSYKGNIILDPFGGTGTVAIVSKMNNRKYIYIDNCLEYCQMALNEINSLPMHIFSD